MRTFIGDEPEIPNEVSQAHEEGRLVFFCGAGISLYTGLPGYKDLVEKTYASLSPALNPRARKKSEKESTPHNAAFHGGRYDQSLHLLERDSSRDVVRHRVVDILSQPPEPGSSTLDLHNALLTLAALRDGSGYRLVTTNFDDRFDLTGRDPTPVQVAPALGPARPPYWRHLTYLHGKIQKDEDPNGDGLILTSADFGAAYLRDGWAARFVVELFREFTVLFVGYSLNDPIVSYLVDALAADMHAGGRFRRAFVLAPHGNAAGEREKVIKSWEAKGIVPLPFNRGQKYARQTRVLTAWATEYGQGLNSRISVALEPTRRHFPPSFPDQEKKSILNNIAWALSKPDGSVAKHFADGNPSPDPTWLAPLSEVEIPLREGQAPARLFDWPSPTLGADGIEKPHLAPLAGEGAACLPSLPLSPVTSELGRWLAQHRQNRHITDWVVSRGGKVHPAWAFWLENEIETIPDPYQTFWRIILSGATVRPCFPRRYLNPSLRNSWPKDGDSLLCQAARPYLMAREPFRLGDAAEPPKRVSDLADFKVKLADEDLVRGVYDHRTDDHETEALVRLGDPLTSSLFDVCRLAEEAEVFGLTEHSVIWVPRLASDDDEVIRRWHGPLLLLRLLVVALPSYDRFWVTA